MDGSGEEVKRKNRPNPLKKQQPKILLFLLRFISHLNLKIPLSEFERKKNRNISAILHVLNVLNVK